MIESFSITHFKGFEQFEIPHLAPITLLAGRNNVGKTTILEAVFTFFDRLNAQILFNQLGWRGVDSLPLDPEAIWAPTFHDYNTRRDIKLSAVIDGQRETLQLKFHPTYVRKAVAAQASSNGSDTHTIKTDQPSIPLAALEIDYEAPGKERQRATLVMAAPNGIRLEAEYVERSDRPAAILHLRSHENQNDLASRYGKLDVLGKQEEVVKFLRIIEPRLKSLSSIATGNISLMYGDIGIGRKIPIAYMGDGISRLLSIIIYIATCENGVVLIDEVDSGIHYSVLPQVWRAIADAAREFNCQIIGTTHSYECLEAAQTGLSGEHEKDFEYIRLDRQNGHVSAKEFDYTLFTASLESNLEVR